MKNNKKAVNEVGVGIIAIALLLFVGAVFFDADPNSKQTYLTNKDNIEYGQTPPEDEYLFYLEDMDIGRQKKVTENFPNIELGAKETANVVHIGNSFRLLSNPFTKNSNQIDIPVKNPSEIDKYLIYFNPSRISGNNQLVVKLGTKEVVKTLAKSSDIPLNVVLPVINNNVSYIPFTFELEKPRFYDVFNWNKLDIEELKVVEIRRDDTNKKREFDFALNKDFLERMYVELTISCDEIKEISEPIKVTLNGYIIANENPKCTSKYNKITTNNISLSILNDEKNRLVLETEGYYKVAYSINKIYFNDEQTYKFNINSFNDIIDVVMYGDFDKDIIDVRLNEQTMTLRRDEVKSIVQYLKFGKNELKFLTKPLEIEEFIIEKNEYGFN